MPMPRSSFGDHPGSTRGSLHSTSAASRVLPRSGSGPPLLAWRRSSRDPGGGRGAESRSGLRLTGRGLLVAGGLEKGTTVSCALASTLQSATQIGPVLHTAVHHGIHSPRRSGEQPAPASWRRLPAGGARNRPPCSTRVAPATTAASGRAWKRPQGPDSCAKSSCAWEQQAAGL